jgi:hypothetical protein
MHRLLTTTAVALLLGSLPALAAEDSSKTPDQSQSGNVTQSGETPGAAKQATEPPGAEPPRADTSGGAPPSAGVSSGTESSDISGGAEERAKELNR